MVPQAGLSENIVDQELGKVESSESSRRTNKKDKGVCLVATYHPLLQNTGRVFHRLIDILIYFILIKKLKEFVNLVPWLRFIVYRKLATI